MQIYQNGITELNKVIAGLSSWYPTQLYLAYCSGVSTITRDIGYTAFKIDNEFNITSYARIPLDSSKWQIDRKNGYGDISNTTYNGVLNIGPYDHDVVVNNYFLVDSLAIGSGYVVSHGSVGRTLLAGNTASLSGLKITFSNGGGAVSDLGIQYRGVLTSTGLFNLQKHFLGVSQITSTNMSLDWMSSASGIWGHNSSSFNFLFNSSGCYLYTSGVLYHEFSSMPGPTGYIFTVGVNLGSTRYMNLTPTDAGSMAGVGLYINEVNNCGQWFSSIQQAIQSEFRSSMFNFTLL